MILNDREQIIELTMEWKGERFADGRPKVADAYLEKLRTMTLEEIWLPLYVKGYHFQFEGNMKILPFPNLAKADGIPVTEEPPV